MAATRIVSLPPREIFDPAPVRPSIPIPTPVGRQPAPVADPPPAPAPAPLPFPSPIFVPSPRTAPPQGRPIASTPPMVPGLQVSIPLTKDAGPAPSPSPSPSPAKSGLDPKLIALAIAGIVAVVLVARQLKKGKKKR